MHPAKYPGAIELIESSGLAAPFAFRRDFNAAAIHQFYATCFFGPNNTVRWITSDVHFTTSYDTFVAALGFPNSGFKIHKNDPNHAHKPIEACGYLLKPLRELDADERMKDLNQVSIWRSPYFIIFQCLIRTIYPKMGDKGSWSGYCIDIMSHLYEHPKSKINVPHFLWHEIRLASFQYKRAFPHAPFIQALVNHVAEFSVAVTHTDHKWVIPAHMADNYAPKKTPSSTSTRRTAARSTTPSSNSAPLDRFAKFIGKAHSVMMKAVSFQCGQTDDVVSRLVSSKNALKARLRDSGALDVSDDEALPAPPPSDFGFPSGPE